VESHIRHVYTPVSLCEIIETRVRVRVCVCARAHNDVRVQAELYRANQIQPIETRTGAPGVDNSQRASAEERCQKYAVCKK